MKIMNMNIKLVTCLMALSGVVVSSCVYDESDKIEGQGVSIIRMQVSPNDYGVNFSVAAFEAVAGTGPVITINRDAVSNSDLNSAVTVNYALDEAVLHVLNDSLMNAQIRAAFAEDGTILEPGVDDFDTFNILPPDTYTFTADGLSGNTLTYASGEAVKELQISLDPATLDFSLSYALPVRLSNASGGYNVSAGTGYAVIQVIVKNQYDGEYHSFGGFGHPSAPRPIDRDKLLATRGATRVATEMGDLGATMVLEVQGDNSILFVDWVDSPSGATILGEGDKAAYNYPETNEALHPWEYYDNMYHPETSSFRLRYGYPRGSGARTVTEEIFLK